MKRYSALVALGAATAIGAGAFLVPAVGSPDRATTHTVKFTANTQKSANLGKTGFTQDEIDKNKAGKIIGFDVVNGTFDPATNTAKGSVAFSTKGGIIYGSLKFGDNGITTGKVTGGTGTFSGATGTIYGQSLNKSGSKTAVTVTYQN
jgi:hypothetical protein